MNRERALIALALLGSTHLAAEAKSKKASQPNIILIFADDVGYGDVGCYGAELIKTPNLDNMAKEGRIFIDAHSASAVSTPSRYGVLTGQYPFRGSMPGANYDGLWRPLPYNTPLIIDTEILTVGKMLQHQGYATACIGKWHLGFTNETTDWNKPLTPGVNDVGFDYYFGVPLVNSGPPYVFVRNDSVVGLDPNDPIKFIENGDKKTKPTATQLHPNKSANRFSGGEVAHSLYKDDELGVTMAQESVEWIKENKKNPFFLYLSTPHIHHPFTPGEAFQGSSECGVYGDFMQELDWVVGEVLNTLKEEGLDKNTLVIFTSDNGGMLNLGAQAAWEAGHKNNGDLLGFKFDVWEGGHRVPFIARWPKQIKAGSVSDQVISGVDILATLADLTGYELEEGDAPDSHSILEAITGNPKSPVRGDVVLSSSSSDHMSLRSGDWIYTPAQGGGGWVKGTWGVTNAIGGAIGAMYTGQENSDIKDGKVLEGAPEAQLYNIAEDPRQQTNVIEKYPEIAERMQAELDKIWSSKQTR